MTSITITLPKSQWDLLVDYADAGIDDKLHWITHSSENPQADRAEVDAACEALQGVINALRSPWPDDLRAALAWALDQIDDDLDPDHQAALAAARALLKA
jgi:hypothetical protein